MQSSPPSNLAQAVASGATSAVGARAEELVFHLLVQIVLILVVSRCIVFVSRRYLGQTDVAGEILAGLVLGPSALGLFAPELMHQIFHPSTSSIFVGLAQVGLILLMFQIGMEFDFKSVMTGGKRSVLAVSMGGIVVPFVCGYLAAPWFWELMPEPRPSELGFRLFFAIAMSITAIPILGRIFMELGLSGTRTAALTIGAAAIDDICGWLLLGVVAAIVTSGFALDAFLMKIGGLALYLLVVLFVVQRPVQRAVARNMARHGHLGQGTIVWLLVLLFTSALITSHLGVFAIIGGFILGVALHDDRRFVGEWKTRVAPLVNTFFLPLFFAYTGLRTDIGSLTGEHALLQVVLVCALAFATKLGGAYLAARWTGRPHREAMVIGVCMNTRALMELVALNVGLDLGVLPRPMFTMLVIMAIVSTYIATPLIRWLMSDQLPHRSSSPQGLPSNASTGDA